MRRRGQGRHLQRRRTQPPRVEHWATRSFFKASRSVRRGAGTLVGAPVAERRTRGSCGLCGTRSRNSRCQAGSAAVATGGNPLGDLWGWPARIVAGALPRAQLGALASAREHRQRAARLCAPVVAFCLLLVSPLLHP